MALKLPRIFGRSSSNGAEPQPTEQFRLELEGEHAGHLIHAEKNQDSQISSSDVGAEEPQSLAAELLLEDLAVDPRGDPANAAGDAANQRGSVQFEDVQVGWSLPEVGDEVVVSMLNNKNPELNRVQDGQGDSGFRPEVLSLDKSSPKLAEAVATPPTEGEGILPYLEQQPYHGGAQAAQDVFVTEATAPAQDVFVTEVVAPQTESQVSVFGVGGGVDEAARGSGDSSRYENMVPSEFAVANAPQAMQDVFVTEFTGSDEELGALIAWLRSNNLIDTSTGEIVWADEAIGEATASNADLRDRIAELRGNSIFDVSTGEILWNRQPAPGSNWYVPDMDSDQSGMAASDGQVNVGGFGGGVDDDRVRVAAGDVNNDGVPEVISGHAGGWSVTGDGSGHGNDVLGASSLLGSDVPPADSFSLNFEEIKQTVVDSADIDFDGPDAEIELPD